MSILTALRNADNALNAAGIAIRTVGHNISNAGNEKYSRQRVLTAALPASTDARFLIGNGVEVTRIERIVSDRIEVSFRDALSQFEYLRSRDLALAGLEGIFDELQGAGIEEALARFFDDVANLQNLPDDATSRRVFVLSAEALAETFRQRDRELRELRQSLDARVEKMALDINRLTSSIAQLNRQIVFAESGVQGQGVANDLRDERDASIRELAELIDIRTVETSSGAININSGRAILVDGIDSYAVEVEVEQEGDVLISSVRFVEDGSPLRPRSGALAGLIEARDDIVAKYREDLSSIADTLIFNVNRVHARGVGMVGLSSTTGSNAVTSVTEALSNAGLHYTPRNGSFDFKVRNEVTGQVKTYNIQVDLDGLDDDDTTLEDLRDAINTAVQADFPSIAASITSRLELRVSSGDTDTTFWFANDTSDVLASLGVNALFTGTGSVDIDVSDAIAADSNLVATGRGGGPKDIANVQALLAVRDQKVMQGGVATIEEFYEGVLGVIGVERAQVRDLISHQEAVKEHLRNERAAFSGVNVDEESIELIKFQRMYQGAARYLGVVDLVLQELLNVL